MTIKPLRIFLDSSDYSVLSNPTALTPEIIEIYNYLLTLVDSGRVKCYFSGSILSEMAPLDSSYTLEAMRRVNVLARLCGTNALVSIDRLFKHELADAHAIPSSLQSVHSDVGEWFPDEAMNFLPITPMELSQEFDKRFKEDGLNRQARRKLKKQISNGKLKEEMVSVTRAMPLGDLLKKIPMKPEDARVMARYIAGDVTTEVASAAFASSISDPRFVMQWISQEENLLSDFSGIVRNPSREMIPAIKKLADQAKSIRGMDSSIGTELTANLLSSNAWNNRQDIILASVANGMSAKNLGTNELMLTVETIKQRCPGLTVAVSSLFSAWRTVTTAKPRTPKLSDFPDAVHAAYAPYVDLFRSDSFMSPHIARQVNGFPVKIVSKLTQLRPAIENAMKELSAAGQP